MLISFSNCGLVRYWQTEENEATWKETVSFIDNYKSHFTNIYTNITNSTFDENGSSTYLIEKMTITNDVMIIKVRQNGDEQPVRSFKIPLKNIKKVERSVGYFKISSHGFYFNEYFDLQPVATYDTIGIRCTDKEMTPRLSKALKHLAKLATEKRKQEREAKNEKF